MPTTKRSSKQVAKDRAALKRLKKSGIYSGKIDLRKAPTRYQLKKLEQLKSAAKTKRPRPTKQKIPGAKITQSEVSEKQLKNLKAPKHTLTTYALPFLRKGQQEPEWRRFTYRQLRAFLAEYKPDDEEAAEWMSYAVAEKWSFDTAAQVAGMRKETNLYFSGVRIAAPEGEIKKRVKSQSPAALRKARERARKGSRGSGGRK